ncbi:hypothetical protein CEXT_723301 [Caerostris extrusa]|uniref:Uncharacterized protein n=1 Tax=Caerostris extrusa TaxID=172846 RepID=A0AAV4XK03_CAEEX|nr:hypothetical protein CEXT_723301 [Caerostris extrusa]
MVVTKQSERAHQGLRILERRKEMQMGKGTNRKKEPKKKKLFIEKELNPHPPTPTFFRRPRKALSSVVENKRKLKLVPIQGIHIMRRVEGTTYVNG